MEIISGSLEAGLSRPLERLFFGRVLSRTITASQLIFQREAAHSKPNFAQPIILAYGTCALAKISRDSAGAWLYAQLAKNLPTSTIALDPYEFRSLQGVLIKRRSLILF